MTVITVAPRLTVSIDGQPLSPAAARAVGDAVVRQRLSHPSVCQLQFFDLAAPLPLALGAELRIGIEGRNSPLFDGDITALRHRYAPDRGRVLEVEAQDRLHRLAKRQPVRTHLQQTLPDLARTLVADLGLQVRAATDGPVWRQWIQYRQSDLLLLQQVAERCGLYFTARGNELVLLTLEGHGAAVELRLGAELLEAEAVVDSAFACSSVETQGWNPWRAEAQPGSAAAPRSGRQAAATVVPDAVGGDGVHNIAAVAVQDSAQAEALAQAELDRRHAAQVVLTGVASGNPAMQPGIPVRVQGLDETVNGRHVLTAAVHRFDRLRGYLTEFDTAPPAPLPPVGGTQVAYGEVTRVDDPDRLGRVRVALPCHAGVESDWLEVLLPAAGAGKGLIALPDVGDRVLLLLVDGDPAQALVLGGVFGPTEPPDQAGVAGTAVRRFHFMTPGGQLLCLDDEARSVRLESRGGNFLQLSPDRIHAENGDGSYLELTAQRVRLYATRDLAIESDRAIVIRGQSIDFERA
jgi:uncharacterized protein involved in type VI secretion and phage assembly